VSDARTDDFAGSLPDVPVKSTGARLAGLADVLGMIVVLVVLVVLFGTLSRNFLSAPTLRSVVNQVPDLTVVAVGMTLVLVAGGIDLSVGSVLALAGSVLGVVVVDKGGPLALGMLAAVGIGALCGLFNGLVTVTCSVPSFIVTLGMLEMARGAAYIATDSQTKYLGPSVEGLARPIAGLGVSPAFLVAAVVVLLGQALLTRTVAGRLMVAVGTNDEAVRLAGIDPRPTRLATFVISGVLAGVAAIFQVARLSSADPNGGIGLELAAIAAVVIGGTSLMGGRGSVVRSFLGVLIIAVLQTGLAQVGASEPAKRLITGAVIVLAVVFDVHRQQWLGGAARLAGRWLRPSRAGRPAGG
jgi:ribose transport system permease protein